LSTNVILVCDLHGFIRWCVAGYEGSAHDQGIVSAVGLPPALQGGKCVLGDAGFANSASILAPYRNVRYHLTEFATDANAPQDMFELFNLRHSSMRVKIECTIGKCMQFTGVCGSFACTGVLKGTWKLLRHGLETSPFFFGRVIRAVVCLHNFLRASYSSSSIEELLQALSDHAGAADDQALADNVNDDDNKAAEEAEVPEPYEQRDRMAGKMWKRYNQQRAAAAQAERVVEVRLAARAQAVQAAAAALRVNMPMQQPPPPHAAQRARV